MSWKNQSTLKLGAPLPYELPFAQQRSLARKREAPDPEPPPEPIVVPQRQVTAQKQRLEKTMGRLTKSSQVQKRLKVSAEAKKTATKPSPKPAAKPETSDFESQRSKIQAAIANFFGGAEGATPMALAIESYVWKLHEETKIEYRKRCRAIYQILKASEGTRKQLLAGTLTVEYFVEHCESDFVTPEMQEIKDKAKENPSTVVCEGAARIRSQDYPCPTCGSTETEYSLLTSHRTSAKCDIWGSKDATERDSVRVFCLKCTAEWTSTF